MVHPPAAQVIHSTDAFMDINQIDQAIQSVFCFRLRPPHGDHVSSSINKNTERIN